MRLVINILAGYRIIRLIQMDSITLPAREWYVRLVRDTWFGWTEPLLTCPWCLGVWVAGFVIMANAWFGEAWWIVCRILSLSAVIAFMAWWDKKHIK